LGALEWKNQTPCITLRGGDCWFLSGESEQENEAEFEAGAEAADEDNDVDKDGDEDKASCASLAFFARAATLLLAARSFCSSEKLVALIDAPASSVLQFSRCSSPETTFLISSTTLFIMTGQISSCA